MAWPGVLTAVEELLDGRFLKLTPALVLNTQGKLNYVLDALRSLPPTRESGLRARVAKLATKAGEQAVKLEKHLAAASEEDRLQALAHVLPVIDSCVQLALRSGVADKKAVFPLTAGGFTLICGSGRQALALLQARGLSSALDLSTATSTVAQHTAVQLESQLPVATRILAYLVQLAYGEGASGTAALTTVCCTAAKPTALLPWLVAAGKAVQRVRGGDATGVADLARQGLFSWHHVASAFARLMDLVTSGGVPDLRPHYGALEGDLLLQQELVPSIFVVTDATLELVGGGGAPRTAPRTARQPAGDGPTQWDQLHDALRTEASLALVPALQRSEVGGRWAPLAMLQHAADALRTLRSAQQGQLGSEARNACAGAALKLAGTAATAVVELPWRGRVPAGGVALSDARLTQVATAALEHLPLMAAETARLLGEVDDSGEKVPGSPLEAPDLCICLATVIQPVVLYSNAPELVKEAQVMHWYAAADACLRLLPRALALQQRWQRSRRVREMLGPGERPPGSMMAGAIIRLWWMFAAMVSSLNFDLTSTDDGRERYAPAAAPHAWRLHTTACRAVNWALGLSENQLALLEPLGRWEHLSSALHCTFKEAFELASIVASLAGVNRRQEEEAALHKRMRGMAAAHAELLPLLAAKSGRRLEDPNSGFRTELRLVVAAAAHYPTQLDPQIFAAYSASMKQYWRERVDIDCLADRVHESLLDAQDWPQLAAALLTSGLLADGLALVACACVATNDTPLPSIFRRLMVGVYVVCRNFCSTGGLEAERLKASIAAAGEGAAEQEQAHRAAICAACERLNEALCGVEPMHPPVTLAAFQRCQHRFLPAATELAKALVAYWEDTSAGQLAAAQAAATRSCAYLRCANLAGQGGPGAGEGKGGRRCGACRAVYYCDTACSHADWKQGGHKKVCPALAAARLREREGGEAAAGSSGAGRGA